jgi:DNA-binding response OmpR family regulator
MTDADPSKHLLVVDDDYLVARGIARWFRRRHYAVTVLTRAADVLELSESYHLAILDIDLADEDGVALGRELLETGRVKHVVFFSATTDEATRTVAHQVGPLVSKSSGIVELERVLSQRGQESGVRGLRRDPSTAASG